MNPPFDNTSQCVQLLSEIERLLGRYEGLNHPRPTRLLQKSLRAKTVHGSVAIDGNTLTEERITAVMEGKQVAGPEREILEVQNTLAAYDRLGEWNPKRGKDLLTAHQVLTSGLSETAGKWRRGAVGVLRGTQVVHVAPPADRVAFRVKELLEFFASEIQTHLLVKAAIVHYELEFIHPFEDGNGRIGRLWHALILSHYHPLFQYVPIESIIRDRQEEYYAVLRKCDGARRSTAFIEFALSATRDALETTLSQISPTPVIGSDRLQTAREHFTNHSFSRKDYLALFPKLSTASASRDLKYGVEQSLLIKNGDKSQARYVFRSQ